MLLCPSRACCIFPPARTPERYATRKKAKQSKATPKKSVETVFRIRRVRKHRSRLKKKEGKESVPGKQKRRSLEDIRTPGELSNGANKTFWAWSTLLFLS